MVTCDPIACRPADCDPTTDRPADRGGPPDTPASTPDSDDTTSTTSPPSYTDVVSNPSDCPITPALEIDHPVMRLPVIVPQPQSDFQDSLETFGLNSSPIVDRGTLWP